MDTLIISFEEKVPDAITDKLIRIRKDRPIYIDRIEYNEDLSYPLQILLKRNNQETIMLPDIFKKVDNKLVFAGPFSYTLRPDQSLEFNTTRVAVKELNEGKQDSIVVYFYQICEENEA